MCTIFTTRLHLPEPCHPKVKIPIPIMALINNHAAVYLRKPKALPYGILNLFITFFGIKKSNKIMYFFIYSIDKALSAFNPVQ